jgi:pSer/pThr/pTyr-binding forkhead associated (FHA) protein
MPRGGGQDFSTDRIAKPKPEQAEATQASPALAALVHVVDGAETQVHPLLSDRIVIGRGKDCNIRVEGDGSVSRKHACVMRRGVTFTLEDLGSSNGVFVNGVPATGRHELKVGDRIEIGDQVYVFKRRV